MGTVPAILAVAAVVALAGLEQHLGFGGKTLWVVAPGAPQGTALEENGGADAGAVMEAELPNFKNRCCQLRIHDLIFSNHDEYRGIRLLKLDKREEVGVVPFRHAGQEFHPAVRPLSVVLLHEHIEADALGERLL